MVGLGTALERLFAFGIRSVVVAETRRVSTIRLRDEQMTCETCEKERNSTLPKRRVCFGNRLLRSLLCRVADLSARRSVQRVRLQRTTAKIRIQNNVVDSRAEAFVSENNFGVRPKAPTQNNGVIVEFKFYGKPYLVTDGVPSNNIDRKLVESIYV